MSVQINNQPSLNYDFSQFTEIVEFVNNSESLLLKLLDINKNLKGIFFGEANLLEEIKIQATEGNLKERCEFISGNIFTAIIPSGFLLYILTNIAGKLDDNELINLFNRFYRSTNQYDRILLIEKNNPDLLIRTPEKYLEIFQQTRFIQANLITSGDTNIMEVLRFV